jgi:hypothetical protein
MNKRQKIVQENFINNEEAIIKRLKQVYNKSLQDITAKSKALQDEINSLNALADLTDDENEKAILKSREQSKIYQKQYQDALKKQVGSILDNMQVEEFKNVSDYLRTCYEDGFVGTMYDLQGQGIPLCFPMDQEAMVRAVQLDSKISQGLYERLGEDVSVLKKKITAQVSRGISTGMSFAQVAQQLSAYTNIGFNNAVRIARTEGHRVQVQSAMDACYKAKDRGADIVKKWDATLDAKTRASHVMVDGEIKELDEKFSNGLMFPGDPSGRAAEVINCRCALLQKPRWSLEGSFTKMNNFTKQLETFESPEEYAEFKKAFFSKENKDYMKHVQDMEDKYKTKDFRKVLDKMDDKEYDKYSDLLKNNPIFNKKKLTNNVKSDKMSMENPVVTKIQGYNFSEGTSATKTSHIGDADCYVNAEGNRFIYQENYDKTKQLIEPQRAMRLFDRIPSSLKAEVDTMEFLDYKNPQDGYWARTYKMKGFTSFATGSDGHIAFWKNDTMDAAAMDDDWIVHTYCHEAAHTLDQKLATSGSRFSQSAKWKKIMKDDELLSGKKSPTGYGKVSPVEDFADSVAVYIKDPVKFEKEFPNRAKLFKGVIK